MNISFLSVAEVNNALNIWQYVKKGVQSVVNWIIESVDSLSLSLDQILLYEIPRVFNLDSILTPELMNLLNTWFPVSYAVYCFVAYCSIAATIFIINWILGLIPTVS